MGAQKATELAVKAAEADGYPTKKMYHVEKFLPPACPKCKHAFANEVRYKEKYDAEGRVIPGEKEAGDYTLLLGDIVDGQKVVRETTGYNIIICAHCRNYTARIPLETYCVGDKAFAEKLVAEEGFVNLMTVTSFGNMTKDHHAVMGVSSGMKVRDAMKDYPDDK
jgi:hypothetical protein